MFNFALPRQVLESLEEVEKFTTASDVAVVGFFTKDRYRPRVTFTYTFLLSGH